MSQPGAQPISVRATSTPSPDVPDMTPTTYAVPVAMWHVARVCSWGAGGRGRDAPRERGLGSSSARHHSNFRVHNKHSNVLCMCMLCVMRFVFLVDEGVTVLRLTGRFNPVINSQRRQQSCCLWRLRVKLCARSVLATERVLALHILQTSTKLNSCRRRRHRRRRRHDSRLTHSVERMRHGRKRERVRHWATCLGCPLACPLTPSPRSGSSAALLLH